MRWRASTSLSLPPAETGGDQAARPHRTGPSRGIPGVAPPRSHEFPRSFPAREAKWGSALMVCHLAWYRVLRPSAATC